MTGIRERLNSNPKISAVAVTVFVIVLGGMALAQMRQPSIGVSKSAFFSADDGKTFFVDGATKVPPFKQGGKEVVSAKVFVCKEGKQFIAYLERAKDEGAKATIEKLRREAAEQLAAHPTAGPDGELMNRISENVEVKRPGDKEWVRATSREATPILIVTCPGGGSPEPATP